MVPSEYKKDLQYIHRKQGNPKWCVLHYGKGEVKDASLFVDAQEMPHIILKEPFMISYIL